MILSLAISVSYNIFRTAPPTGTTMPIRSSISFKTDSGVLTVVAEPTKWSGGQEGYALSLPISDHCSWWLELDQKPYTGGEAGLLGTISEERAWYLESPDNFQSPTGISVEVQGGVVVMIKVYIS